LASVKALLLLNVNGTVDWLKLLFTNRRDNNMNTIRRLWVKARKEKGFVVVFIQINGLLTDIWYEVTVNTPFSLSCGKVGMAAY
jgi:hypothetical protein